MNWALKGVRTFLWSMFGATGIVAVMSALSAHLGHALVFGVGAACFYLAAKRANKAMDRDQ